MSDELHDESSTSADAHDAPPPFHVAVRASTDRTAVLALCGEVDLATAPELRRALSVSVKVGVRHLILDCRELAFVDAAGLGAFVEADTDLRANGGALVVRDAAAPVRTAIEAAGLDHLLEGDAPLTTASHHATG